MHARGPVAGEPAREAATVLGRTMNGSVPGAADGGPEGAGGRRRRSGRLP